MTHRTIIYLALMLFLMGWQSHPSAALSETINSPLQRKTQPPTRNKNFKKFEFANKKGKKLVYYLMKPNDYDATKKYPLVLALHGRGGNTQAAAFLGQPKMRKKYPCFVMAPVAPRPANWARPAGFGKGKARQQQLPLVFEAIAALQKKLSIDKTRIYVTGQSMGGFGSFGALAARPNMFAAAVPICGGWSPKDAARIAKTPIWVFHGADDKTVPVRLSRKMVEAVKKAGGSAKYTEYKGVGHNSWTRAYKTPELWVWLFAQKRKSE